MQYNEIYCLELFGTNTSDMMVSIYGTAEGVWSFEERHGATKYTRVVSVEEIENQAKQKAKDLCLKIYDSVWLEMKKQGMATDEQLEYMERLVRLNA